MKDVLQINRIATVQDDAKHVAKFVRVRHGLLDRFRTKQKGMRTAGEKQLALSIPIPTRWYTAEKCVRSVFKNQYIIRSMFDDSALLKRYNTKKTRPKLERAQSIVSNQNKWKECKRVVDILSPINQSLALCEQNKTYISSIYSEFVRLKDLDVYHSPIEDAEEEDRIAYNEIQSEVLQLIEGRCSFLVTAPVRAAYLLDQTTDISKFVAGTTAVKGDLDLAMSDILTMAKAITSDPKVLKRYEGEIEEWSRLRQYWHRTKAAPTDFPCSPSSYWMMHGSKRFPLLSEITEKLFTIPSSSAASERSWSIHDFIHTKRRNRLHATRVEKLVFVYSNIVATTSEPVRDNVADDMYPDAHDGDLGTSDDEDEANGNDAFDDEDEAMDTAEEHQADEEM
ncbi:hypothetical protein AM588_10001576 [Phytophthora nicotianae]|uniref:HAT C-terminal dimerisation domain-containing protein n=1 Tax=Phytophthora nicotianae TaxID=4792 RepID=A0A0W8CT36_PHYNI|nr:hypothetical protein AM588_10001576 [Phytophthora nicotianae]